MLPVRQLETDLDFSGDAHGEEEARPIRRIGSWTPLARGANIYGQTRQLPFIAGVNADFRDGYCSLPMSNSASRRASTAMCYLDASVRQQQSGRILTRANVLHLLLDGRRVTGVRALVNGEERDFLAREVILCAGAVSRLR